jgi:5'-3' exonuclease
MGVKGLYTYVKQYRRPLIPDAVAPLNIGVDAMSLIYKYKADYKQLYPYIHILKDRGHRMIFVFDGKAPAEKGEEIKDRRDARESAVTQATTLKAQLDDPTLTAKEREVLEYSVARLEHQGWHMTREIRLDVQKELDRIGVSWIKALEEADDVLIDLAALGTIDVVMSTDMDFLIAGIQRLWIPARDSYEEVLLDDVMKGESLSAAGILDAGILCGVEPLRGLISVAPKTAFSWMRHYGSIEGLLKRREDTSFDMLRDQATLDKVRLHFAAQEIPRVREEWLGAFEQFTAGCA